MFDVGKVIEEGNDLKIIWLWFLLAGGEFPNEKNRFFGQKEEEWVKIFLVKELENSCKTEEEQSRAEIKSMGS